MVPPPQKLTGFLSQRAPIKASSPVCKRLFAISPDPCETKRMMQEMVETESLRLKTLWDFDHHAMHFAATKTFKSGVRAIESPTSAKIQRFEWELQDRQNVPQFYTRPFRAHHSEARNLHRSKKQNGRMQKVFEESKPNALPLPLTCRDENTSPVKTCSVQRATHKEVPTFASPPKITSANLNPTVIRPVTALRVPPTILTHHLASPLRGASSKGTSEAKRSSDERSIFNETSFPDVVNDVIESGTTKESRSQNTVMKCDQYTVTSRRPASRRLFSKRSRDGLSSYTQLEITGMIPCRKLRSATKRTCPSQSSSPNASKRVATRVTE